MRKDIRKRKKRKMVLEPTFEIIRSMIDYGSRTYHTSQNLDSHCDRVLRRQAETSLLLRSAACRQGKSPWTYPADSTPVKPSVLRLGLLQNRNVLVGVFPQREELLVGGARFAGIALQDVGSRQPDARQCSV